MSIIKDSDFEIIRSEIERSVVSKGYELWDLEFKTIHSDWTLTVYIDKSGGVTIDDCVAVSNALSLILDVEDKIPVKYTLEVSSPGMDRRLRTSEQFQRYAGRKIRVKMDNSVQGRKKYIGVLEKIEGDEIVLKNDEEKQTFTLPLAQIDIARLEIDL